MTNIPVLFSLYVLYRCPDKIWKYFIFSYCLYLLADYFFRTSKYLFLCNICWINTSSATPTFEIRPHIPVATRQLKLLHLIIPRAVSALTLFPSSMTNLWGQLCFATMRIFFTSLYYSSYHLLIKNSICFFLFLNFSTVFFFISLISLWWL